MHSSIGRALCGLVALGLVAAPLLADAAEDKAKLLADTVKSIDEAVKKGDATAAEAAFAKAAAARKDYDVKEAKRIAQAIGKGVKHKDAGLALASINALGKLQSPGSSKLLGKYMRPPLSPDEQTADLYLAAIRVAGEIHDGQAMGKLEGLLRHRNAEVGGAAAKALAGYRALEPKPRMSLIKRLIKQLKAFEKTLSKGGVKDDVRSRAQSVRVELIGTLVDLSEYRAATTSSDWTRWLQTEGKAQLKTGP